MPDVRGKRIVVFGDSLSSGAGSPGAEMAAALQAGGAAVQVNARIGRSAHNFWTREDTATQLAAIQAFRPNLVIVELGTNDIGLAMSVDRAQMQKLRTALAANGAEVWAFGPPAFRPELGLDSGAAEVVTMMLSVFGNRFIDLRRSTRDMLTAERGRAADGVHFTSAGGEQLGKRMADQLVDATSSNALIWAPLLALLAYALFR